MDADGKTSQPSGSAYILGSLTEPRGHGKWEVSIQTALDIIMSDIIMSTQLNRRPYSGGITW